MCFVSKVCVTLILMSVVHYAKSKQFSGYHGRFNELWSEESQEHIESTLNNMSGFLSVLEKIDQCCVEHQTCRHITLAQRFSFEHWQVVNPHGVGLLTRVNCTCETQLKSCLKEVNSTLADMIGFLYFTFLGGQCSLLEHPITGCQKYESSPWRTTCAEYALDTTQPKIHQWFDVPEYELSEEKANAIQEFSFYGADIIGEIIEVISFFLERLQNFLEELCLIIRC